MLRLRKRVFADGLGWKLHIDEDGREVDQFDDADAEYSALISKGQILAYGRLRRTDKPSLLFDVYPNLIDNDSLTRGSDIWKVRASGPHLILSPAGAKDGWAGWLPMRNSASVSRVQNISAASRMKAWRRCCRA